MSGHSKHIGSSKNRVEARARSYARAQAKNIENRERNEAKHTTNKMKLSLLGVTVNPKAPHKNRPSRLLRAHKRLPLTLAYLAAHPEAE